VRQAQNFVTNTPRLSSHILVRLEISKNINGYPWEIYLAVSPSFYQSWCLLLWLCITAIDWGSSQ